MQGNAAAPPRLGSLTEMTLLQNATWPGAAGDEPHASTVTAPKYQYHIISHNVSPWSLLNALLSHVFSMFIIFVMFIMYICFIIRHVPLVLQCYVAQFCPVSPALHSPSQPACIFPSILKTFGQAHTISLDLTCPSHSYWVPPARDKSPNPYDVSTTTTPLSVRSQKFQRGEQIQQLRCAGSPQLIQEIFPCKWHRRAVHEG